MLPLLLSALALTPPLAEAPQLVLPGRSYGGCPAATGAAGEVAISTRTGARFLQATRDGFTARGDVKLGDRAGCPEVSARPNGAAVVATTVSGVDYGDLVVVALRDPEGGWGAPVWFPVPAETDVDDVDTAVSDSGDAVVAWREHNTADDSYRLRVARRAPGEAFGPAATIGSDRITDGALQVGVAATGETFVMSATVEATRLPIRVSVRIAVAPRGGALGSFTGLGLVPWRSLPALAVAQDGRALVALPDGSSVLVAERAPGESFGAPVPVGAAADIAGVRADVALGGGGEAAVAWAGDEEGATAIVTRRTPGPFTPAVTIKPRTPYRGDPFRVSQTALFPFGIGFPFDGRDYETLALTGDGHAALTAMPDDDVHGVFQLRASLTTVPLGGDRAQTRIFGGVLGLGTAAIALELADGTPALAWSERIDESGTLHLAAQGATMPPEPPPPTVRVGDPVSRVVEVGGQLVLPVTCSGPCDVRGQALGGSRATGRLRLTRRRTGLLKLDTGSVPLAPRRLGPVRIRLTYGRLNTQRPSVRMVTVRLVRPPDPPAPRVVGLRAQRRGNTIRVTWRTRNADGVAVYFVTGAATREWNGEPSAFDYTSTTRGRSSFSVTLSPADGVRWVTLRSTAGARVVTPVR